MYAATGTCHAFLLTGCWQDREGTVVSYCTDISRCTVYKTLKKNTNTFTRKYNKQHIKNFATNFGPYSNISGFYL